MSKFGLQFQIGERKCTPFLFLDGISLLHTLLAKELTLIANPKNPPLPPHPINQLSGVALAMAYDYSFPPNPTPLLASTSSPYSLF